MADNANAPVVQNDPTAVGNFATGGVLYPATAIVVSEFTRVFIGFAPRYVKWVNATDGITIEWFAGMGDNTSIKTAADGAVTLEALGITVDARGFRVSQVAALAAVLASKQCYWLAQA